MKRSFLVLLAAAIFCSTVPSLFAEPEQLQTCCSAQGECGSAQCCDPKLLDMPPCDLEKIGYCMAVCIRPTGGG